MSESKETAVEWWATARHSAAKDFGRRHSSKFAAFEVIRRIAPAAAIGAVVAALGWAGVRGWQHSRHVVSDWHVSWVTGAAPTVIGLVVLAAVVAIVAWAARRWMWLIDGFLPLEHTAVWLSTFAVVALGSAAAVTWWVIS